MEGVKLAAAVVMGNQALAGEVRAVLEALGCRVFPEPDGTLDLIVYDSWGASQFLQREATERELPPLPYRLRILLEDEPCASAADAPFDDFVRYCKDREELRLRLEARLRIVRQMRRLEFLERNHLQAVEKLRASEERFRTLVESITDVFYVTDANGRLVYASPNLFSYTGYQPQELLGRSYLKLVAPEDRRWLVDLYLGKTAAGAEVVACEFRALRKDGSRLWADQRTTIIRDEQGHVVEYRNVVRDISERKAMEQALRESEERYRSLYENVAIGLYRTTPDGHILMANPALVHMLGFESFEELASRNLEEEGFEPSYPRELFRQRIERDGQIVGLESAWKRRDGSITYVRESARAVKDESGRVLYYEGTAEDITEKVTAEKALQESEELFRALAEAAPAAVLVLQGDRLLYVNKFAKQLGGYPDDDSWKNVNFWELEDPACREQVRSWADARERGEPAPHRYELPIRTRDGQRRWLDMSVVTFQYRGQPARMAVAVDITDKKATEEQLLHAQKMEAIGRLAGSVAHDFNNMLSVIMAHAELLKFKSGQDPGLLAAVDGILGAATRAAELTRKLLAFARKQQAHPERLDLNAEVGGTLKVLKRLLGENVELIWEPADDLWPVLLDRSQVDQVVANLVVNARDAVGDKGHIWVVTANRQLSEQDCRQLPEGKPGRYVVLSVKDDGCGMSDEVLQRIFEPFFTTKGEGKGTGLGLSTVFGIVKQNNGFIRVESELGKGSTFEIYFPAVEVEKQETQQTAAPIPTGWETVLLVEDQPEVLEAASNLLQQLGYRVLAASTPLQALGIAASHAGAIHLLLSDVGLPEMNGGELAQRLVEMRPGIKVLLMSGYTSENPLRQEVEKTWGPVLEKPLTVDTLACRVREVLDASAHHGAY